MKPTSLNHYLRGGKPIARPSVKPRSLADHNRVFNRVMREQEMKIYAREQALALGKPHSEGDRLDLSREEALELREIHWLSRVDDLEQRTGND